MSQLVKRIFFIFIQFFEYIYGNVNKCKILISFFSSLYTTKIEEKLWKMWHKYDIRMKI